MAKYKFLLSTIAAHGLTMQASRLSMKMTRYLTLLSTRPLPPLSNFPSLPDPKEHTQYTRYPLEVDLPYRFVEMLYNKIVDLFPHDPTPPANYKQLLVSDLLEAIGLSLIVPDMLDDAPVNTDIPVSQLITLPTPTLHHPSPFDQDGSRYSACYLLSDEAHSYLINQAIRGGFIHQSTHARGLSDFIIGLTPKVYATYTDNRPTYLSDSDLPNYFPEWTPPTPLSDRTLRTLTLPHFTVKAFANLAIQHAIFTINESNLKSANTPALSRTRVKKYASNALEAIGLTLLVPNKWPICPRKHQFHTAFKDARLGGLF